MDKKKPHRSEGEKAIYFGYVSCELATTRYNTVYAACGLEKLGCGI